MVSITYSNILYNNDNFIKVLKLQLINNMLHKFEYK